MVTIDSIHSITQIDPLFYNIDSYF